LFVAMPLNWWLIPPAPAVASPRPTEFGSAGVEPPRNSMLVLAFFFAAAWFVTGAMAAHLPRLFEAAGASPAAAVAAAALVGPAQVAARIVEFGLMRRTHPLIPAGQNRRASGSAGRPCRRPRCRSGRPGYRRADLAAQVALYYRPRTRHRHSGFWP